MPKLPVDISGQEAVKAFRRAGWTIARFGVHIIMEKENTPVTLSIPNHKILARGTLRSLLRDAELSVEEFVDLL